MCLTLPTLEKIQYFWTCFWNTFKIPDRSTVLEQFLGVSEFDDCNTEQQEITFTSRFPLRASKLLEWLYSLIGFPDLRIYTLCDSYSLFAKHPLSKINFRAKITNLIVLYYFSPLHHLNCQRQCISPFIALLVVSFVREEKWKEMVKCPLISIESLSCTESATPYKLQQIVPDLDFNKQ